MYEGTPDYPDRDRWWSVIERYGVTILYAAPTAIRTFMKWGTEYPGRHDLTSLRVLGSVGEPINPEAWMWYSTHIGGGRCPVVDTWWQTETGAMMIAPLPGITATKPGSATHPLPGIAAEVVDEQGAKVDKGGGYLTLTRPWPAMLRGLYGDPERYREADVRRADQLVSSLLERSVLLAAGRRRGTRLDEPAPPSSRAASKGARRRIVAASTRRPARSSNMKDGTVDGRESSCAPHRPGARGRKRPRPSH